MIIGIGNDVVRVERIRNVLARKSDRFVKRILTPAEREVFNCKGDPAAWLAKRFAAKEAASKALGTGIGKVSWQDFEVLNNNDGAPVLCLLGAAQQLLTQKGGSRAHISISDEQDLVTAFVVLEG